MRLTNHDGMVMLEALPRQESHMLSNLASAHALVWLPTRAEAFAAGERVSWIPI
jgi:molybdopterin molybdotransferase